MQCITICSLYFLETPSKSHATRSRCDLIFSNIFFYSTQPHLHIINVRVGGDDLLVRTTTPQPSFGFLNRFLFCQIDSHRHCNIMEILYVYEALSISRTNHYQQFFLINNKMSLQALPNRRRSDEIMCVGVCVQLGCNSIVLAPITLSRLDAMAPHPIFLAVSM